MNKVPLYIKLSFAAGGIAVNLANLSISQWLLRRYIPSREAALVSSAVFLTAFFIGRLIDGILDPLIGNWSDKLRRPSGRRLPFIRICLIPVCIVSTIIWLPPDSGISGGNAVFVFIMIQLFFIFWTALANPYMALLPELTDDKNERITISTMLAVCYMIGTILFAFTGSIISAGGYSALGIFLGAVILLSFLPAALFIRERPQTDRKTEKVSAGNIIRNCRQALSNRAFRPLLIATSLFWFALNSITVIIPFWIETAVGGSEADVPLVMGPFIAANIVFFFVFSRIAKTKGKYPAFIISLAGSSAALFLFTAQGLLPLPALIQSQIVMGIFGIFVAGFLMLPNALLADVIDNDEKVSGSRREGLFFGLQSIFQKITIGLSISVSSALMYMGGTGTATVSGLKLTAAAGAVASAAAVIIFLRYPLREAR